MIPLSERDRSVLAKAIFRARNNDKSDGWTTNRSDLVYLSNIGGLRGVRSYVQDAGLPKRVLDVGVGKGLYLEGLQKLFKDFELSGTTLSPNQVDTVVGMLQPPVTIYNRTPEQLLRQVQPYHFGAIISVCGLIYSPVPDQTIRAVDKLLAPGGVLKMRGYTQNQMPRPETPSFDFTFYDNQYWHDQLLYLGYDVATDSIGRLAAIKPFGNPHLLASDLLYDGETRAMDERAINRIVSGLSQM